MSETLRFELNIISMQEDTNSQANQSEPTLITPIPAAAPAVSHSSLIKDLMIPISIVIAGLFIGGGLYFSGGSSSALNNDLKQPEQLAAKLTVPQLVENAGVDIADFNECVQSGRFKSAVEEDIGNAVATGGQGTPWSILVGPGGKTYPINGALPLQAIEQVIALAKSEASQGPSSSADPKTNDYTPVTEDDHLRGDIDAEIMIIEYSDFDCPFCKRFHETMLSVIEKYPANEVAWVYRHFPLEQLHPNAPAVALASECVADLGSDAAFWKFADAYEGQ